MKVSLIAVTTPVGSDLTSPEEVICYAAKVSNPKNQNNKESYTKLIKYCLDNKHFSIFEMADMTVEITTSRAIAQQILRHKSFCFQEFSQRYQTVASFQTYEARRQDVKNRQNSIDDMDDTDKEWFTNAQKSIQSLCESAYNQALSKGIAKEQARFLLPLSTTTKLYMKGSVRSWIHYLELRTGNGTQKEHQEVALAIKEQFKILFPTIAKALEWL